MSVADKPGGGKESQPGASGQPPSATRTSGKRLRAIDMFVLLEAAADRQSGPGGTDPWPREGRSPPGPQGEEGDGAENAQTNALFLGMTPDKTPFFNRTSSGGNVALSLSQTGNGSGGQAATPDQGPSTADFLLKMLAQTRALTWDTAAYASPAGATDVRLYRVKADQTAGFKAVAQ